MTKIEFYTVKDGNEEIITHTPTKVSINFKTLLDADSTTLKKHLNTITNITTDRLKGFEFENRFTKAMLTKEIDELKHSYPKGSYNKIVREYILESSPLESLSSLSSLSLESEAFTAASDPGLACLISEATAEKDRLDCNIAKITDGGTPLSQHKDKIETISTHRENLINTLENLNRESNRYPDGDKKYGNKKDLGYSITVEAIERTINQSQRVIEALKEETVSVKS